MDPSEEAAAVLYIVEDDDRTREELARILGRHPEFSVRAFAVPSEALNSARTEPPDMALLDLRLPEMDGLALLGKLQEISPFVLAIIMTGYGDAASPLRAREGGAVDFVEKPLDLPYLLVSLRQQARESRLRKGLRASAAVFSQVLELLPDGILLSDLAGRTLFANSLGRALWEKKFREPGSRADHAGRVFALDRFCSEDRVLWHWMDMTQALEMERLAGYREMSRLLAHEIRNPLTPMRLWLQELMAMDPGDPAYGRTAQEAHRVLLQQVDRMSALVGRFKALGQEAPLSLAPVSVAGVSAELEKTLAPFIAREGVEITWPAADGCPAVMADEASLYHLLFNLIRNAVEASAGRGTPVRVGAGLLGGRVVIEVEDHGGGFPPEVAAAPYTPYLTTKEGGTGLGLLVCRELARRMGGELVLQDREGVGVIARLTLKSA